MSHFFFSNGENEILEGGGAYEYVCVALGSLWYTWLLPESERSPVGQPESIGIEWYVIFHHIRLSTSCAILTVLSAKRYFCDGKGEC